MKRKKVTYKEQLKELQDFVNNDMPKIIESQRKAIQEFEKLVKGGKVKMTEYQAQAKQFLADCNATMEIKFVGKEIPAHWKDETKPHNKYQFTITTPKGKYTSYFWDSLHNTEMSEMTVQRYAERKYKISYDSLRYAEKVQAIKELDVIKAKAKPTEYDILACVEKYSYDSFSDFCAEFGYSTDSISARETFLACGEEYAGLRRIFTEEQMEKLREIY